MSFIKEETPTPTVAHFTFKQYFMNICSYVFKTFKTLVSYWYFTLTFFITIFDVVLIYWAIKCHPIQNLAHVLSMLLTTVRYSHNVIAWLPPQEIIMIIPMATTIHFWYKLRAYRLKPIKSPTEQDDHKTELFPSHQEIKIENKNNIQSNTLPLSSTIFHIAQYKDEKPITENKEQIDSSDVIPKKVRYYISPKVFHEEERDKLLHNILMGIKGKPFIWDNLLDQLIMSTSSPKDKRLIQTLWKIEMKDVTQFKKEFLTANLPNSIVQAKITTQLRYYNNFDTIYTFSQLEGFLKQLSKAYYLSWTNATMILFFYLEIGCLCHLKERHILLDRIRSPEYDAMDINQLADELLKDKDMLRKHTHQSILFNNNNKPNNSFKKKNKMKHNNNQVIKDTFIDNNGTKNAEKD